MRILTIVFIIGITQSIGDSYAAFVVPDGKNGWSIVDTMPYERTHIPAPKPLSYKKKLVPHRFGNIAVYRLVYRGCGYSEPGLLVICLRADGTMDRYDKREMRKRVRHGGSVTVGSDRARRFVSKELGPVDVPVKVVEFSECSGSCGLRVEVKSGIRR